jgi:hypothetical protein
MLLAGVLVDRLPRRLVVLGADLSRGLGGFWYLIERAGLGNLVKLGDGDLPPAADLLQTAVSHRSGRRDSFPKTPRFMATWAIPQSRRPQ